jgi:hypothetical protein
VISWHARRTVHHVTVYEITKVSVKSIEGRKNVKASFSGGACKGHVANYLQMHGVRQMQVQLYDLAHVLVSLSSPADQTKQRDAKK